MPNSNYVAGRRAEYLAVQELKKQGAVVAQRTAGSHSPIDVFALMHDGTVKLVQIKKDDSPLELDKLEKLPAAANVSIELWHRVNRKWTIHSL